MCKVKVWISPGKDEGPVLIVCHDHAFKGEFNGMSIRIKDNAFWYWKIPKAQLTGWRKIDRSVEITTETAKNILKLLGLKIEDAFCF